MKKIVIVHSSKRKASRGDEVDYRCPRRRPGPALDPGNLPKLRRPPRRRARHRVRSPLRVPHVLPALPLRPRRIRLGLDDIRGGFHPRRRRRLHSLVGPVPANLALDHLGRHLRADPGNRPERRDRRAHGRDGRGAHRESSRLVVLRPGRPGGGVPLVPHSRVRRPLGGPHGTHRDVLGRRVREDGGARDGGRGRRERDARRDRRGGERGGHQDGRRRRQPAHARAGGHGEAVGDAGGRGRLERGEGGECGRRAHRAVEGEVRCGVARDVDADAFGRALHVVEL
mmetsp:Transcript_14976/g.40857  ORF Transcript_14976/g.40857 Transcript_14976/m.40857 type:complete len:284 (+) Transcript_14976:4536-5387(+)